VFLSVSPLYDCQYLTAKTNTGKKMPKRAEPKKFSHTCTASWTFRSCSQRKVFLVRYINKAKYSFRRFISELFHFNFTPSHWS